MKKILSFIDRLAEKVYVKCADMLDALNRGYRWFLQQSPYIQPLRWPYATLAICVSLFIALVGYGALRYAEWRTGEVYDNSDCDCDHDEYGH